MQNSEICVPAESVQIDGTTPAQGDKVEVTLKGPVTRVEGKKVYFNATEANGQPIEMGDDEEKDEGDGPAEEELSEANLRAQAAKADELG